MAGMLAAFMSTHDSYLLAWASSLVQDVVGPMVGEISDATRILLTRIFIFLIGCFLLLWGLWFPMDSTLWNYMAVTGTIYFAGAFAVVAGGLYWRRASSTGAVLAMIAGCTAVLGIVPWDAVTAMLDRWADQATGAWAWTVPVFARLAQITGSEVLSQTNIALTAVALAAIGMILGSLLFPDRHTPQPAQEVAHG